MDNLPRLKPNNPFSQYSIKYLRQLLSIAEALSVSTVNPVKEHRAAVKENRKLVETALKQKLAEGEHK